MLAPILLRVRRRRTAVPGLVVGVLVLVVACGGGADHNGADVSFAQGMIPHHEQAIVMSDLALTKAGSSPEVRALAERIKAAQEPEILRMEGWLEDWGEPLTAEGGDGEDHAGMDMGGMSGMMSDAEMRQLEASSGADFDRLFLEGVIRHHEGAVSMAKEEQAKGKFDDAKELAGSIITSQEAEIAEMKALLAAGLAAS